MAPLQHELVNHCEVGEDDAREIFGTGGRRKQTDPISAPHATEPNVVAGKTNGKGKSVPGPAQLQPSATELGQAPGNAAPVRLLLAADTHANPYTLKWLGDQQQYGPSRAYHASISEENNRSTSSSRPTYPINVVSERLERDSGVMVDMDKTGKGHEFLMAVGSWGWDKEDKVKRRW